jgi:hypothetical protein
MKRLAIISISILTILLTISTTFGTASGTENSVKGTLTVNEETFQLNHVYVYEQDDEVAVFMTDNPVSQDNVPFDLGDLAYEGKLHGLSFGISKSTKKTTDSAHNAVYHKIMMGRGGLSDVGKLTIKKFDNNVFEGTLTLDKPGTFPCFGCPKDHTYLYDVTFKVNLGGSKDEALKPIEIIVAGDDTPAAKAYASYYRAKMAGDVEEVKKWVVKEHVKDFEGEMAKMMIKMAMTMDPKSIKIVKTELSGNSANLTIKGQTDDQGPATGHVKMVLENGQWKVHTDKWDMTK